MTSIARNVGVALIAIASVVVVEAASAATATQTCGVAKLKAAGNEVRAKMICYAKAKKAATSVDSICLMNAQTRADATINKAGGACDGTATDIDAAVDFCVSTFLTDDPGNRACPAVSAKVIGNGATHELACQATDVRAPGTLATCDMKEDGKTTARLGKAGGGTPCVNMTSVMTDIDSCDTGIDALVIIPSCSTSQAPTCGGVCPTGEACRAQCDFGCGPCQCVPTCVISQAPTCGGSCPIGQVCGQATDGAGCECVTTDDTCAISQVPMCGGTCPTGQVCGQQFGVGNFCECVASDDTCVISQAPACGGTYPNGGDVCTQIPGTGGDNGCNCAPPGDTCAIGAFPECGGTCPTGQVCRPNFHPAVDACECVASPSGAFLQ